MTSNGHRKGFLLLAALVLCGWAPARAGETALTRWPHLQALLDTSVWISWKTDAACIGKVRFASEGGAELVAQEAAEGLRHGVRLEGLAPATVYSYRVFDGDRPLHDEAFRFRTAPPAGPASFRAVVFGDSGWGKQDRMDIAARIEEMAPDLLIHTGDLDYLHDIQASWTPCGARSPGS